MDFDNFIKENKVILGEKDIQKTKALIKIADNTLKFIETVKVDGTNASPLFTLAYDALRVILEAICLLEGYKVYSHEAYTFYLKKIKEDKTAEQFDRFRKLRNGINYYGKPISEPTAKEDIGTIKNLCLSLKKKYLRDYEQKTISDRIKQA